MRTRYNAAITALGGYVPETILTNHDLEEMVDTSSDWIVSRTGIKERRIARDKSIATSDMATIAVQRLLHDAKMDTEKLNVLLLQLQLQITLWFLRRVLFVKKQV